MIVKRKTFVGVVVSGKCDKTRKVLVTRTFRHPLYKKTLKKERKITVHDQENKSGVGDVVRIVESRPISKMKRWALLGILKKSRV